MRQITAISSSQFRGTSSPGVSGAVNGVSDSFAIAVARFATSTDGGAFRFSMNAHVAPDVCEFTLAGLTQAPSKLVNVPRVAESPVSFECKLTQIIQLQNAGGDKVNGWLTLGEVVAVHIDKSLIQDGVYQTAMARSIVRAGRRGDYFEIRPDAMFEMVRPD